MQIRARIIELKQTLTKYALSMKAIDKVNTQVRLHPPLFVWLQVFVRASVSVNLLCPCR